MQGAEGTEGRGGERRAEEGTGGDRRGRQEGTLVSHTHQDELGGAELCRKGEWSRVLRAPGKQMSPGVRGRMKSVHSLVGVLAVHTNDQDMGAPGPWGHCALQRPDLAVSLERSGRDLKSKRGVSWS